MNTEEHMIWLRSEQSKPEIEQSEEYKKFVARLRQVFKMKKEDLANMKLIPRTKRQPKQAKRK